MAPPPLDEYTVSSTSPLPLGFVFVKKGDVYVTKYCRKLTHESGRRLYVVEGAKKQPLGLRVPTDIYAQVQALNQSTATDRAAAVAKKDLALDTKAHDAIIRLFPSIPRDRIDTIVKHALQKHSGRVGRSTKLPLDEIVVLGVRAHIRHTCTDYDKLLRKGTSRDEARRKVQKSVDEQVGQWGGTATIKATAARGRKRKETTKTKCPAEKISRTPKVQKQARNQKDNGCGSKWLLGADKKATHARRRSLRIEEQRQSCEVIEISDDGTVVIDISTDSDPMDLS